MLIESYCYGAGRPANLESKKILRFLYLYCSIAVCSKKKTGRCYAETKKKEKKRSRLFKLEIRDIRATNREILSNEG